MGRREDGDIFYYNFANGHDLAYLLDITCMMGWLGGWTKDLLQMKHLYIIKFGIFWIKGIEVSFWQKGHNKFFNNINIYKEQGR